MIIGKYIISPLDVGSGSLSYDSQAERYCVVFTTCSGEVFTQYVIEKNVAEKLAKLINECTEMRTAFIQDGGDE